MTCLRFVRKYRQLALRAAVCTFTALVLFSLFNYKSRVRYEIPTMFADPVFASSASSRCRIDLNSFGLVTLNKYDVPELSVIEEKHFSVHDGGRWSPSNCNSWQKVAIIVPYRDRASHLVQLLDRLHDLLQKQMIYYQIFVIEQAGSESFNRGRLLNVGVMESLKRDTFDCFIFHDVDLLPEHNANMYYCNQHVHHLASAIDEMRYHVMYYNYLGGVLSINRENVFRANGHANDYWGWGNEDDDFNARTEAIGLLLTRPPEYIGRYKMIRHTKQARVNNGNSFFLTWRARWKTDGLNNVDTKYRLINVTDHKLFTTVLVDLGKPTQPDVSTMQRESIFWFLNYYFP